ncbi:protein of unknown function [Clostridium beijerinckii]|nr:protein of unknown function [Clostridium beijerinckii]
MDEISLSNFEIEFRTLICKLVVKAWYPLLKYKLRFGLCDNLAKVATYISDTMIPILIGFAKCSMMSFAL